jgi:uncharacterized protein (DUF58 family)
MAEPAPLLDPAFVRELEALRRRLEVRARSGARGERSAPRRGGTSEFQEHRPYVAGDDLRRVDWLAFARTGEPVLKLFRTDEDSIVRILLDGSASLDYGDPAKFEVARRLAAAIGYMALAGSQRAQLLLAQPGASDAPDRSGGLGETHPPRRGRSALARLLRDLDTAPRGRVELARAVDQAVQRSTRPGLLVLISDFLDAGPVTLALGRARSAGHDVALLQVLDRTELQPSFDGDLTLVDAETGAELSVTLDASALEAYALRLAGLVEELRGWARRHGCTYVRASTEEPLEAVVRRFVGRGVD